MTKKGNYIIGLQKMDEDFLDSVDRLFEEKKGDAYVLGQYPVLSTGMLSLDDYSCCCPPAGVLAVSGDCYSVTGPEDKDMGWAIAADYFYRLTAEGYKCETAYDIKAPSYKEYPTDITELWIDGLLLDYKLGNRSLRKDVIGQLFKAIFRYDISIGNYSRKTVLKKLPYIGKLLIKYGSSHVKGATESINYFRKTLLRGSFSLPELKSAPLVSVIIRTHRRPNVLKKTLNLLRNQTYKNYEIILIEDGE
ncbi:MAG: glycosyltransferase, partial [Oscillospiraceae bacterium]|nr:glycosyltransferase [Oscillospiraceae bacterium]